MTYILIFFVLLSLIVILGFLKSRREPFENAINFSNDGVMIGKSCVGDRGAFATKDFKLGEVVEVCPMIFDKRENIPSGTVVSDYVFSSEQKGEVGIAFGYCSMFNHSDDYNVGWKVHRDAQKIVLTATKDIKQGEELFISYGDKYWNSRKKKSQGCTK